MEEVEVGPAKYTINIDDEIMFRWAVGNLLSDAGAKTPPEHSVIMYTGSRKEGSNPRLPTNEAEYLSCVTIDDTSLLPTWEDVQDTIEILKEKERRNWIQGQAWRCRMEEYPNWEEQLDFMYHNGFDAWKTLIKDIKDKFPTAE